MTFQEYEIRISLIAAEFSNNPLESKEWEIEKGRSNWIKGLSGQPHQIDVSLICETDIVLIECKKWNKKVSVSEFLVLWGRVRDIAKAHPNKRVRGALITTLGWQRGVEKMQKTYSNECSVFQVSTEGEVYKRIHKAFLSAHINDSGSSLTANLGAK